MCSVYSSDIKSLQEISFEVIRNNFSRFTAAYQVTKDEALKKNLYFLQRVYTQTLFSELEQSKELKEEHFDFLLNEHLKKLDLGSLLSCSTKEKILEKVLPIAPSLHELSCYSDYRYEEDTIFIFTKLIPLSSNVKKINIPSCDDSLINLISSNCSHLLELSIEKTNTITGNGIKALCLNPDGQIEAKCPLKHLNLSCSDTQFTIEDIAFLLKNMPTLEEVLYPKLPEVIEYIHQLDIDNNIVSDIKQFNLHSLDFMLYHDYLQINKLLNDYLQITKLLTLCTERCPKVKKLSVKIFSSEDIDIVSRFSNLENLTIKGVSQHMGGDSFMLLDLNNFLTSNGKDLKNLTVDTFQFSELTLIANCPNLETLTLRNIEYQEPYKDSKKKLDRLRDLHLQRQVIDDWDFLGSVITLLNSSPNLESLSVGYTHIAFNRSHIVAKLSTFFPNCNLSHLQFDYSDVGVDLLDQFIMNCPSIKTLSLNCCHNISWDDICMLNQTKEAYNRKVIINFTDKDNHEVDYVEYDFEDDEFGYN